MTRKRLIALGCALTAALSAAPAGIALAAGNAIINDCQSHGELTHRYTARELRHALAVLPSSVKQYTNCSDVINKALLAAAGTGSRTGAAGKSSSGSFLPTPVIIILVVLILAAVTFAALAVRRRRSPDADPEGGPEDPSATRVMPALPLTDEDDTETRVIGSDDDEPETEVPPPE